HDLLPDAAGPDRDVVRRSRDRRQPRGLSLEVRPLTFRAHGTMTSPAAGKGVKVAGSEEPVIDPAISLAGLLVGFVVGLTGMGGGALMTPLLVLLFKIEPLTAVSSDIVASMIMK